jgi:hypothetical protein
MSPLPNEHRGTELVRFDNPEMVFQQILEKLWDAVVKPILDKLAFSVGLLQKYGIHIADV